MTPLQVEIEERKKNNIYVIGVKDEMVAFKLDVTAHFMRPKDDIKYYMISSRLSVLELMDKRGIYKITTL